MGQLLGEKLLLVTANTIAERSPATIFPPIDINERVNSTHTKAAVRSTRRVRIFTATHSGLTCATNEGWLQSC